MLLRIFILLTCLAFAITVNEAAEPSLGQTLKKVFATPTPTPHRKKKTAAAAKKKSPTPTPTPKATPSSTAAAKKKTTASPTPSPRRKKKSSPTASPTESPTPTPTPSPTSSALPYRRKKASPTPQASESPTPTESPSQSASPSATPKRGAANASLSPEQIKGFENYPENVKRLLGNALELTTRNLTYKYGSDDPASGGMDCSGFVYFVLKQNGAQDVPRDSSQQYVWLRRAGKFEAVFSRKENSFELENLQPGDLLFWTGTYAIDRDPPITHAMIYLGREKKTGRRVMVGASDGRVYQGESRYGVSVFDFNIPRPEKNGNGKLQPMFIGYGHIPGLREPAAPDHAE